MTQSGWRSRAGTTFELEKRSATASRGMVVSNHPLGSAAGAEMLAAGGNAIDAAIATLFALTVVEPMMVGIFGAGMTHLRLADGRHRMIDNYTVAPASARADMYRPVSETWPDYMKVEGDTNTVGPLAVGVPGTLKGWCEVLERFGTADLESVLQPAIRHAERGFRATPYLVEAIAETAPDLARYPASARILLRDGAPPRPGELIRNPEYADTLRAIARGGPDVLYGGALGGAIADYLRGAGGIVSIDDLRKYRTVEREPVRGHYRGHEIVGPAPPSAGGIHVVEMLNVLEGYDVAGMGYGTPDYFHLLAEVLKIGFADRDASTGDPDFLDIPVARLTSKEYAALRRGEIDLGRAGRYAAGTPAPESSHNTHGHNTHGHNTHGHNTHGHDTHGHTTHVTTGDADGNLVAMTQTLNNLFGSRVTVPGTGVMLNNNMALFDPHPGRPNSVAPGKRMRSSMAPTIVVTRGRPVLALGLPGGVRISTSVMQGLVNWIDHGMSLQETVEAPRVWTQGQELEIETRVPEAVRAAVAARGHAVLGVSTVAGGMNAVAVAEDGTLTGAACWRADGTPIGVSGGLAKPGVRFHPNAGAPPPPGADAPPRPDAGGPARRP